MHIPTPLFCPSCSAHLESLLSSPYEGLETFPLQLFHLWLSGSHSWLHIRITETLLKFPHIGTRVRNCIRILCWVGHRH